MASTSKGKLLLQVITFKVFEKCFHDEESLSLIYVFFKCYDSLWQMSSSLFVLKIVFFIEQSNLVLLWYEILKGSSLFITLSSNNFSSNHFYAFLKTVFVAHFLVR